MSRLACAAVLVVCLAPSATAQELHQSPFANATHTGIFSIDGAEPAPVPTPAPLSASTEATAPAAAQPPALRAPRPSRPGVMIPLYASFAALQAADFHSTTTALARGAGREANPALSGIAGNRAAFAALKATSTVGIIWAGEKLWKKNRAAAVVMMAVANGVMAAVVGHNYTVK